MNPRRRGLLLAAVAAPLAAWAGGAPPDASEAGEGEVDAVLADARRRGLDRLPFAALVQAVAQLPALLGKPYLAGSLDLAPERETLFVSFAGFDCVTYAETVLALARTLARQGDAATYASELAALRYRHGQPAYCERLHYFSDWIRANAARGTVRDVSADVASAAGVPLAGHALPSGLDFMSSHAAKLPALADSPERRACIAAAEADQSAALQRDADGKPVIRYVQTEVLLQAGPQLRGGDLLALVADKPGLDTVHVGLVLAGIDGGPLRVINASSRYGKVEIAPDLRSFFAASPKAHGAIVVRPLAPN